MIPTFQVSGNLEEISQVEKVLVEAGLSPAAAKGKSQLFVESRKAIPLDGPAVGFYVPGRVEVLGKHTDYAGGESLVAPIERGFCLVSVAREDHRVILTRVETGETIGFEISADLQPVRGHWANYPMTVIRRVARNFPRELQGVDIAFGSDLPPAAGMSSSSAFLVAIFLALATRNQLDTTPQWQNDIHSLEDLASYLATVENGQSFKNLTGDRGVGTLGGSEDHIAILLGRPRHLIRYLYIPVQFIEAIPLPPGYVFAIGASGVVAEKTGAALEKYNAASNLARQLVSLWQQVTGRDEPTVGAIVRLGPQAVETLRKAIREQVADSEEQNQLRNRLEHFLLENEEVLPQAANALRSGNLEHFGQLVDRSQWGAEHLLGNQVPETIFLARSARELGAVAASAFGAGFGGAVWALVEAEKAERFLEQWRQAYLSAFPEHDSAAEFLLSGAGPAAFALVPS